MTNIDLLKAAAKAAGLNYEHMLNGYYTDPAFNEVVGWTPLTDDGDALRLAVKLGIESCWHERGNYAVASAVPVSGNVIRVEEYGPDALHATRRAIVRAAAAMVEQRVLGAA